MCKGKMSLYCCPVCKWIGLDEKPVWPYGTHEICECCGTQFGFDVQENQDIEKVREEWLNEGAIWFDEDSGNKPKNWSYRMALIQIESR